VQDILQLKDDAEVYQLFQDIDEITLESVTTRVSEAADDQSTLELTKCLHAAILAHKTAIHAAATDVHAQAVAYYNLGWTEYRAHLCLRPAGKRSAKYLKASIRAFKRAIELESGNAEFWSALGVATSQISPKVAQHSFVRSLFLNERSGQTWTNLGTLALLQNDVQMANEAFTRAQSADPDYGHAWVGQGLVALMMGDPAEARLLFTHALEISDASSAAIKRQYSVACFDHLLEAAVGSDIADLVQPIFALNQLQTLAPTEIAYTHLSTLFLERVADSAAALSLLSQIAGKIEAAYEVTESPADMSRFALAKADLARIQLANGQYEEAIESGDTALQLGEEDAGNNLTPEQRQRCRLSAHLTVGLAHYHNGNPSGAVSYIEAALEESGGNPDAVCLLAQVLWATGTSDARDKARDKLFEAIEAHPGHVQSVLLVGAISLIDGDSESLDAVTSDLHSLRTSSSITSEEQSMVGELLRATAAVSEGDPEKATLEEVQRDVFLFPHTPAGWSRLADAAGEEGQFAADMSLQTAEKADETAAELAGAYAGTGRVGDAQRAILYAPWCKEGWGTLQKSIAVKG
jgi:superkiller protein 3